MSKHIKEEKAPIIIRKEYSQQELDRCFAECNYSLSEENRLIWLESKKAIRRYPDGHWTVLKHEDEFPYTQLCELWEGVNTRQAKKEYAARINKQEMERLNQDMKSITTLFE